MRILNKGTERCGEAFSFTFDDEPIEAHRGETIAAALAAGGRLALRTDKTGAPRGLHCAMGICFECLVHVNAQSNLRACMHEAAPGDAVRSGTYRNLAPGRPESAPNQIPSPRIVPNLRPDVLVIGGGPAGLSAALAAASAGADVVVLDERQRLGGQYYKQLCAAERFVDGRFLDRQYRDGRTLIDRVRASDTQIHTGALVWGAFDGPEVSAIIGAEPVLFRPRSLILATGAYERGVPMPGWTLPGFMTTGALQTLLRSYRVCPGERVLISGNGPLNLQVAAELTRAGVTVVALVEASRPARLGAIPYALTATWQCPDLLFDAMRYVWTLRRAGVPILTGHSVVEAQGTGKVTRARVVRLNRAGQPAAGAEKWFDVDVIATSYGFYPSNEVARALGCEHHLEDRGLALAPVRRPNLETTVAGIFVVGDCAGLGGARAAIAEGALAGMAAAHGARARPNIENPVAVRHRKELARHRRFQRALWRVYESADIVTQFCTDETLVCRCEEVTLGEIKVLAEAGASIGNIKRQCRAGMGRCQGRYCSPVIQHLLASMGGPPLDEFSGWAPRIPFKPVAARSAGPSGE